MTSRRLSIRIPENLERCLQETVAATGKRPSEVVREALEEHLAHHAHGESCYDLAKRLKLIGVVRNAPKDLSTDRKHFEGFGR